MLRKDVGINLLKELDINIVLYSQYPYYIETYYMKLVTTSFFSLLLIYFERGGEESGLEHNIVC